VASISLNHFREQDQEEKKKPGDNKGKDWNDAATSQSLVHFDH
jgi:hypothetical protein